MIAQKPKQAKKERASGRNPRPSRSWVNEYAAPVDQKAHSTYGMATAWGRTAAVLGWDLEQGLAEEVAPEWHEAARSAYNTAKRRAA